jgi:hypothetical protein
MRQPSSRRDVLLAGPIQLVEQVAQADRRLGPVEEIIRVGRLPITVEKILIQEYEWLHARLIPREGRCMIASAAR